MGVLGPRLVVAGTHSGVGKTTVATGLMAALRRAGHRVGNAKVGPDFIDPGYHSLATGRPPRNLDAWMSGLDAIAPLAGRAAHGTDVLIVEGVMGLFDGASDGTPSSTADVAAALDAPVVLVVDSSAMSSSVAALVRGFRDHDPRLRFAGVILNRVGGDVHGALLREALAPLGVPVLGELRRDDALQWRDRHLGLVPVAEQRTEATAALNRLAGAVTAGCDLAAIVEAARRAPSRTAPDPPVPYRMERPGSGTQLRIAVAAGAAFTFTYTDNLEAFEAAGAELVRFDPLVEAALPEAIDGLVIGGGFPEVYAERLAANRPLLDDLCRRIDAGLVTWAECGGLLLLAEELDGHRMGGVLPAAGRLTGRLTLGYREATTTVDTPVGPVGTTLRGHEFHYSTTEPAGAALTLRSRFATRSEGYARPTLLATYVHGHLGADPAPAAAFVQRCAEQRAGRARPS
jgi:cobyrinic acid a,c-diamide synthase